jgi:hypothetical protein
LALRMVLKLRTHEYRGQKVDGEEWVYGYYCFNGWTEQQKHKIIPDYASALYGFEVNLETVGEFTGFYDINGSNPSRKLWEGDVLCSRIYGPGTIVFAEIISVIIWDNHEGAWMSLSENGAKAYLSTDIEGGAVYAGNIFDHGHLVPWYRREDNG